MVRARAANLLRRFGRSRRGTAAMEFCIIAPVLLLLAGAIVEFGRAYEINNQANRLATQYAIAFADCSDFPAGICQTELNGYVTGSSVHNISPYLKADRFTLSIFQVKMNGTTPKVVYKAPASATLTAAQTTAAQQVVASGQSGVVVTVTYQHQIELFRSLMSNHLGASFSIPYTVAQLKS